MMTLVFIPLIIIGTVFIISSIFIIISENKKISKLDDSKLLQNKITTDYFEIDISYNVIDDGGVNATFKTIKYPNNISSVIYDGGSFCLESSFHNHLVIYAQTIEELKKDVSWTICYTKKKIQMVEKNLGIVEINKSMVEIDI